MGLFNRNSDSKPAARVTRDAYTPSAPSVPAEAPRVLQTVGFTYDPSRKAATQPHGVDLTKPAGVNLSKGFKAATDALLAVELPGIRMQVIVLLDGSGSMRQEYERRNGEHSPVERLLVRTLGFALNVDTDKKIPVIVYGSSVNEPVDITIDNFENAGNLIQPDFGTTNMTAAFQKALQMVEDDNQLTLIVNITDGNPNNKATAKAEVIRSSGMPIMVKNLAIKPVSFLDELDDMESKYDIRKDENGKSIEVDGKLVIDVKPNAPRLLDNVDSKAFDPYTASDEQCAKYLADEIANCLEVMARVGTLTGVPGFDQEYEL